MVNTSIPVHHVTCSRSWTRFRKYEGARHTPARGTQTPVIVSVASTHTDPRLYRTIPYLYFLYSCPQIHQSSPRYDSLLQQFIETRVLSILCTVWCFCYFLFQFMRCYLQMGWNQIHRNLSFLTLLDKSAVFAWCFFENVRYLPLLKLIILLDFGYYGELIE